MAQEALSQIGSGLVGNRSLLRRMNSLGLLRAVMAEPQTLRQLASASGLSRTAVDSIVSDLVDLGWLDASDGSGGRPGRPAATYDLASDLGLLLSVDIGANHIHAIVTDLAGRVWGTRTGMTSVAAPAEERVAAALDTSDKLLERLGLARDAVRIVSIGSPGVIGLDGEVLHFGGVGMPGWVGSNLRERFAQAFAAAILVEGDVALGAHAELTVGAAQQRNDVVYVLVGARTSGAAIVDGKVHRGVHGAAGIVGELPELRWAELAEQYGSAVLSSPRPSREEIFALARKGDERAVAAVDEFAEDLAIGAAALVLALDPELLVIGGGSAPGADVFLARFEEQLRQKCPVVPEVRVSSLGSEAVAMGGISLAREHLDATLVSAVNDRDAFPGPAEAFALARSA